jgi:hypothetical protein
MAPETAPVPEPTPEPDATVDATPVAPVETVDAAKEPASEAEPVASSELPKESVEVAPEPVATYLHPGIAERAAVTASAPEAASFINPSLKTTESQPAQVEEKAEERGRVKGQRRGFTGGMLVGLFVGNRHGRNKAERKAEAQAKKQSMEISELATMHAASEERVSTLRNAREHVESRLRALEQKVRRTPAERPVTMQTGEATRNILPQAEAASVNTSVAFETKPVHLSAEKLPSAEKPIEEQPITEETYTAPKGHRFETSAWHRYEVDAATGKLAENPSLVYGEEFKKEQKQERLQDKPLEAAAAVQIGHAIVQGGPLDNNMASGAGTSQQTPTAAPVQPTAPSQSARSAIKITAADAAKQVVSYAKQPLIWLAAAAIVVLLFTFGLLH